MEQTEVKPQWDLDQLPEIVKNVYIESPSISSCTSEEVRNFQNLHQISVEGPNVPKPIQNFSELNIPQFLQDEIKRQDFVSPTPLQCQGWPVILSGENLIGVAKTGSGKTLGYILPSIVHILRQPTLTTGNGPIALILAPTRELVQQIHIVTKELISSSQIRSTCLFAGGNLKKQLKALSHGVEICISTPGRLLEFLESGKTDLQRCSYFVMDEADRMLDMGFESQIRKIIEKIRPDRQTLLLTATWPQEVRNLANELLGDCIHVNVGVGSQDLSANQNIQQIVDVCGEWEKEEKLLNLFDEIYQDKPEKAIVFCKRICTVNTVVRLLRKAVLPAAPFHSDKSQQERDFVLSEFRNNRLQILVATDVASRGLDVDDVKYVINYDCPRRIEDYIHRIGRTGRADKKGTSYTFFTKETGHLAGPLLSILKEAKQEINPELEELRIKLKDSAFNHNWRDTKFKQIRLQNKK